MQYETRFSTVSGQAVADALVGEELQFVIYATDASANASAKPGYSAGCSVSGSADNPLFTGLPVTITN